MVGLAAKAATALPADSESAHTKFQNSRIKKNQNSAPKSKNHLYFGFNQTVH